MAESSNSPNTVTSIEERREFMVPYTGGCQETHRVAHFLKPTVSTMKELPTLEFPDLNPSPPNWPLKLHLNGWPDHIANWREWVTEMEFAYECVWKQVGIYDAIKASTLRFPRNNDLITVIAERWCPKTNTFIFPWGEATITLEDMLVLGGFPVLGHDPVSFPLEDSEDVRICHVLENACLLLKSVKRNDKGSDTYSGWLLCYRKSDIHFEHEAFLALWLSRFVFPSDGKINNRVFPIAIHLARGRRLALAPAVLASIYRDLRFAKESMVSSTRLDLLDVNLWSPFQLVQAWAWERLPTLRPKAYNVLGRKDVRLARWSERKGIDIGNLRPTIISAGDTFVWRPYTLELDGWSIPSFYMENEERLQCDDGLGDEFKSFLRCLRACMLVGMEDCVESYNPHRVCMQFGYDQDIPGWVPREPNATADMYNDERLYVPARLYQGDWTRAYAQWWRYTVLCLSTPFSPGLKKRKRGPGCGADVSPETALTVPVSPRENVGCSSTPPAIIEDIPEIPPGFEYMFNTTGHTIIRKDVAESSSNSGAVKVLETPPGFNPKSVDVPPGFGSSLKIGKRSESILKQPENRACSAAANMSNDCLDETGPSVGRVGLVEHGMNVSSQNDASLVESVGGTSNPVDLLEASLVQFEEYVGALKESLQICKNSSSVELRAQVPLIKARIAAAIDSFISQL